MARQKFRCYIYGKDSDWEAICTDLDISVQDDSFEDAKSLLNGAITSFLEVLEGESEADRKRLLNRRSPLWLRTLYYWSFVLYRLHVKKSSQKEYAREENKRHGIILVDAETRSQRHLPQNVKKAFKSLRAGVCW